MFKNQSDLIALIVSCSVTVLAVILFFVFRREPVVVSAPTEVVITPAALPAGDVVMTNGLPGGGGGGGGRGGRAGGGMGMGGFAGRPGPAARGSGGMAPPAAAGGKAPGFSGGGSAVG